MRITIGCKELLNACKHARRVIPTKGQAILGYVRLRGLGGGRLAVEATNLDQDARTILRCGWADEGEAALLPRTLIDALKGGRKVTIESDGPEATSLRCTIDGRALTVQTAAAAHYPACLTWPGDRTIAAIPAGDFVAAARAAIAHASDDETRPNLCGAHVVCDPRRGMQLQATDGHRLYTSPWGGTAARREDVILPTLALQAAVACCPTGADATVDLRTAANDNGDELPNARVLVRPDGAQVQSRLIDGAYPDLRAVMPRGEGTCATIRGRVADLEAALEAALPFASGRTLRIQLLVNGRLQIAASSPEAGSTTIDVRRMRIEHRSGNAQDVAAFNGRYVLDALRALRRERFALDVHGSYSPQEGRYIVASPAIFREGAAYVAIMPMRV